VAKALNKLTQLQQQYGFSGIGLPGSTGMNGLLLALGGGGQPPAAVVPPPAPTAPVVPPPASPPMYYPAPYATPYAPSVGLNPMAPVGGSGSIPVNPWQALPLTATQGGQITQLGNAACQLISNPTARAACVAAASAVGGWLGNGQQQQQQPQQLAGCPSGYVPDGKGGCRIQGIGSYLPGDVGRQDFGWQPVAGMYGIGASPIAVARTTRACPPGFVLGKDGVCYDRLPRSARAHNPGTKPLLTGGDVNALNRARSLQKRIGKLNTRFGPKKRAPFVAKKRCK